MTAHGATVGSTQVVAYTYDAWGNPLTTTGTMADTLGNLNPFRYRGYVYDTETGLYYLQSRYYNPETGRFINADGELADIGESVKGYNLFAYCQNNPVTMSDSEGNWPKWAKKIVAAAAIVIAVTVVAAVVVATAGAGSAFACAAVGAAKGAFTGFIAGAITGAATNVVSNRVKSGSWSGSGKAALAGAGNGALSGTVSGLVTGGITSNVCFVAGTSVASAAGLVAIESIQAGDKVWSEDPDTGTKELKEVVRTFVNETDKLVHVTIEGETIDCTPEHPFYSPVKGWTEAIQLRAGDILVTVNGDYVVVEQVQHEILETPVQVFNFEVSDFHTYFVGDIPVLVHNVCGKGKILPQNGTKLETSRALDLADDFLGKGYSEPSPGRFVSADNLRQVRMTASDLAKVNNHAGAPHLNFETLAPNPLKPGKFGITGRSHIFIFD